MFNTLQCQNDNKVNLDKVELQSTAVNNIFEHFNCRYTLESSKLAMCSTRLLIRNIDSYSIEIQLQV